MRAEIIRLGFGGARINDPARVNCLPAEKAEKAFILDSA
jgi:hypothetical protein